MLLWTFACGLLLAIVLVSFRLYLARTSLWLNVHLRKIELLKASVDDPLQIVRGESEIISLDRLAAGFALAEARFEYAGALCWIERGQGVPSKNGAPRPSRLKSQLYAWLILRESKMHYLLALKFAQPQSLDARSLRKLNKLGRAEEFHRTRARDFIERLNRK
jgi:hypothetical protein